MCLIAIAYKVHPHYPLIVAANRDEFRERPAEPAHFWEDAPDILAGRDLRAGGTWLGITRSGRFAALTNYRDLRRAPRTPGPSRGNLVRQALDDVLDIPGTAVYEGFNLFHGPLDALRYHNNIEPADVMLAPGIHGLSNHFLDTPWPKVERAKADLQRVIARGDDGIVDALFALLANDGVAPDDALPDTGLPLAMERAVSPVFIPGADYGTRCSTVVLVDRHGHVLFRERTWPIGSDVTKEFDIGS